MPTLSAFFGVLIRMYKSEHNPPHFHAEYGEYKASFDFDGNVIEGSLPPKQTKVVAAWALLHEDELITNWNLLQAGEEIIKIAPLKR